MPLKNIVKFQYGDIDSLDTIIGNMIWNNIDKKYISKKASSQIWKRYNILKITMRVYKELYKEEIKE